MYTLLLQYYATAAPTTLVYRNDTGLTQAQCITAIDAAAAAGIITRLEMKKN